MTVIVGATDGKTWSIGGDRAVYSSSGVFMKSETPKVFRHGDALIGSAGVGPVDWLIQEIESDDPYAIARALFERKVGDSWRILIVRREGLYEIDDTYQVIRYGQMGTIGIGEAFCTGALAALRRDASQSPEQLVTKTLMLAAGHVSDCRWGTVILTLPEGEEGGDRA